jgi:hypothetical protein
MAELNVNPADLLRVAAASSEMGGARALISTGSGPGSAHR